MPAPPIRILATLVAFVGAAVVTLAAQDAPRPEGAPPTFRAATTLVPLDVRVLDKSGRPVTDLTAGDFTIVEDRVRQEVRHFSQQTLTPAAVVADEPLVRARRWGATSIEPPNHRVFLIVLGRGDLVGPSDGIDGVIHMVRDRLLPQDRVAIAAWNRATDFTVDRASSLAVLERFKRQHRKVETDLRLHFSSLAYFYGQRDIPAAVQSQIDDVFGGRERAPMRSANAALEGSVLMERRLRENFDAFNAPDSDTFAAMQRDLIGVDFDTYMEDVAQTMQDEGNLYAGIEYLRHLEGEKQLVWLTEYGLRRSFGPGGDVELDLELGRRAADARVVLNVIRAGGTEFGHGRGQGAAESKVPVRVSGVAAMALLLPAAVSRTLAEISGGRSDANRFPNASVSADYIEAASRSQYVLGYYPTNAKLDGRFRNVSVAVNRPGLTVLVRGGYYAREEADGGFDREGVVSYSRISAAAGDGREVFDLGIAATAVPADGGASIALLVNIDLSRLTFERASGRNTAAVDIAAFCLDAKQRPVGELRRRVLLTYTDQRLADVRSKGTAVALSVPVKGVAESVKLVAYTYADDLLASRNVPVRK
jgi:VWFA-related protein